MKIEQEKNFNPITITLETQEEAIMLKHACVILVNTPSEPPTIRKLASDLNYILETRDDIEI